MSGQHDYRKRTGRTLLEDCHRVLMEMGGASTWEVAAVLCVSQPAAKNAMVDLKRMGLADFAMERTVKWTAKDADTDTFWRAVAKEKRVRQNRRRKGTPSEIVRVPTLAELLGA
jgi:predicted ArsR family transcriptional regulator